MKCGEYDVSICEMRNECRKCKIEMLLMERVGGIKEQVIMSQNMMTAVERLYEDTGIKGLREFQKSLKDYMSKVVALEKLGDEMDGAAEASQKVLDKLAKQTKKNTKELHKSLRSHFTLKWKAERELAMLAKAAEPKRVRGRPVNMEKAAAKAAAVEEKRVAKEAAAAKKNMGEAFRYFKRIQRDANRVKAAAAKKVAKEEKEANMAKLKAEREAAKEAKAAEIAQRKAEREERKAAKEAEPKRKPGRPKKLKVMESASETDDLLVSLLAAAEAEK